MAFDRAAYDRKRYVVRVSKLKELLGGKCVECGTFEDLHFDHIDPTTKLFSITKCIGRPMRVLLEEIKKCQLLCGTCHKLKSDEEARVAHGGGVMGRNKCSCKPCTSVRNSYINDLKFFKRLESARR